MGKGDKRTRRGKIFKGSFGKKQPTQSNLAAAKKATTDYEAKVPKCLVSVSAECSPPR